MKLPIPLLLSVVSLGLVGLTGWTVYKMLPIWRAEVRDAASRKGQDQGRDLLGKGRSQDPQTNWMYTRDTVPWWQRLTEPNLIGTLPPPTPGPDTPVGPPVPPKVEQRPLDQLIELVSLVYDGKTAGKGGNSHVVVRFKPEANVQPPDWCVKENMTGTGSALPGSGRDVVPGRGAGGKPKEAPVVQKPGPGARPGTPLPTASLTGREMLQKLWAQDDGDPRRSAVLWPMKSNDGREIGRIRLVRVADDAQAAYFVRELPPSKEMGPPEEPKEEELIKTVADLSQDILVQLRLMQGRAGAAAQRSSVVAAPARTWTEVAETTGSGNHVLISRKDADRFREHSDDFLEQITVDTYAGRSGTNGLIVKAVDPRLASFGVTPGDVLLEINGKKVESKAQAVSAAKSDYNRGVRTFTTKWLSNGQVIERIFQSPPDQ